MKLLEDRRSSTLPLHVEGRLCRLVGVPRCFFSNGVIRNGVKRHVIKGLKYILLCLCLPITLKRVLTSKVIVISVLDLDTEVTGSGKILRCSFDDGNLFI